jgi:microcin C transport system substrate-binding protein
MKLDRRSLLKLAALTPLAKFAGIGAARAEVREFKHASSFFGVTKYPPGFGSFDYVNPNAPKAGTLRLPAYGSFDSFNAFIIKGDPAAGIGLTFETLTTQAQDEVGVEYGLIAESMYHPPDYSMAAFRLRPEAVWHDGTAITPEDVIFGFEFLKANNPRYQFYFKNVVRAEKSDAREVVFIFDSPGNRELPQIVGQIPPLPKHYWEGKDDSGKARNISNTTLVPPLGNGPYRVKNFAAGQFVTYERIAGHWSENLGVRKGQNNFGEIHYLFFRDRTIAFEAFKGDQVDVRMGPGSVEWVTQYDFPAAKKGLVVKETFYTKDAQRMQAFAFNTRRPKFAGRRVRKAFVLAYDFEGQMKVQSHGNYNKRLQSFFANSEMASTGLPAGKELAILEPFRGQIPDEVFTQEFVNPVSGSPQNLRKNLREALDLLKQAGWALEEQKLVNETSGEKMTVEFLLDDSGFEDVVLYYKPNLEKLGIEVTIRTVDSSQYQNRIVDFDFDVITDVWAQSQSPGNEQREYWGSLAADKRGSQNTIGIKNPAIDKIIEQIIFAKTREDQIVATRALDRVLLWNHYVVSQFYRPENWLPHWDRFGHPEKNPDYDIGFPNLWWWDEEKAKRVAANK